jgi:hypothetical protein
LSLGTALNAGLRPALGGGVGIRIGWQTSGIRFGKHVRGGTYVVPSGGNCFGADGKVDSDAIGALSSGASGLLGACATAGLDFVIWSRPNVAKSRFGGVSKIIGHLADRPRAR